MKNFLICSAILSIIAISGLIFVNHQANAIPVSYNVSSLSIPFSSLTFNSTSGSQTLLTEGGYNGSITSVYEAHADNFKLYYKLGYHPTLPLVLDTNANITASGSVAATQSIPITIPSGNNNIVIVVGVTFRHDADTNHNNARMSSVAIGTKSFSLAKNETITCVTSACDSEIWYLFNPPTGANTITITPSSVTTYHMIAGAYAFHNVRGLAPIGVTSVATGTSVTPAVSLTPTFTGRSWILDNIYSSQTTSPSASSNNIAWVGKTAAIMGASQYNNIPSIGNPNTLSWTTTNVLWASTGIEIYPIQDQNNFNFYLSMVPNNITADPSLVSGNNFAVNGSNIYYASNRLPTDGIPSKIMHINTITGNETRDFSVDSGNNAVSTGVFVGQTNIYAWITNGAGNLACRLCGNMSIGADTLGTVNNEWFGTSASNHYVFYNTNGSTFATSPAKPSTPSFITYVPTSTLTPMDSVIASNSLPNHANRWWNGMLIKSVGNYYTNGTMQFFNSINSLSNIYKAALTIPPTIYGFSTQDVRLLGHWNGQDYFISFTTSGIKYIPMTQLTTLLNENRALQPFILTLTTTDNNFYLSPSSINPTVSVKYYGPTMNTTALLYGMATIPSGYTARFDTNAEHDVRTLDPRWLNLKSENYPAIFSTGSLFPIFLTVSNAPTDASLMITSQSQTINNLAGIWSLVTLDTSHTAEFDIPPNTCVNVYVADNSVYPLVYSYQGNVCASGVNQKTVYYTNTLPTTFYTMKYGATSSYVPSSNALTTTVRSTVSPFTYNVLIRNSTGSITTNSTFTVNSTSDSHTFNVSNTAKPGALFISVPGTGTIYSTYLGSALSFAGTVSFFHQYFSYQGFDMLSFIPIIFAAMFTRNTVGIGMAMVAVLIATLSFLSVVVINDATMGIIIVISIIGLLGYRGLYG